MDPRIKRQLVRQALDENLSTIEGRPAEPGTRRPASAASEGRQWSLLLPGLVVGILLGLGLWLRTPSSPEPSADEPGVVPATAPVTLPTPPPDEDFTDQLLFAEPKSVDPRAFPLEIRHIMLDPGHGGTDTGTTEGDLAEKDLTLDIAQRLRPLLEEMGFEVSLTREEDVAVNLRERGRIADELEADLFISIHINWLSTRKVRGIETYYLGSTDDPDLIEFARRENRDSGYSRADMRPLIDQLYTNLRQVESRQLAERVQRALYTSLKRVNPDLVNRGVKTAPFLVLISTEVPAVLAEVACLSNREEAELLARPLYREHIAEALARAIRGYAEQAHSTEGKGT